LKYALKNISNNAEFFLETRKYNNKTYSALLLVYLDYLILAGEFCCGKQISFDLKALFHLFSFDEIAVPH